MSNHTTHKNLVRTPDASELPFTPDVRFDDLNNAVKIELHLPGGSLYVYAKIVDRAEGMVPRFTVRYTLTDGSAPTEQTPEACNRIYARDFLQDVAHLTRNQANEMLDAVTTQAENVYLIGVSHAILSGVR